DFVGLALRIALGENPPAEEMTPKRQTPIVQRYFFPTPGTVVEASGQSAAAALPGVLEVVITARPGDVIPPAGDKRPTGAMVIATGESRDAAVETANAALARISIRTQ